MSEFICLRCDNEWDGRLEGDEPKNCPKCKSPAWNKPRVNRRAMLKAHAIVCKAKRDGEIVSQPCNVCGDPYTNAHHEDYDKPLEVVWLCPKHHKERHMVIGYHEDSENCWLQCNVPQSVQHAAKIHAAETGDTLGGVVTRALCVELGIKNVPSQPKRGAPKKL